MRLNKFVAVLLAALLMLSLFAIPAFAEETDSSAVDSSAEVASSAETGETEQSSAVNSSATGTTDDKKDEKKEPNWDAIITGGIVLLALIVLVVVYFVSPSFHAKVNKFFRDYKSELSKVVWSPLRDVKKNTAIVLIFSAFFAIVIGLLDSVFSKGVIALKPLIDALLK